MLLEKDPHCFSVHRLKVHDYRIKEPQRGLNCICVMSTQISMGVRHTTFKQTPADNLIWGKICIITDQLPRIESVTVPLHGQFDAGKFDVLNIFEILF